MKALRMMLLGWILVFANYVTAQTSTPTLESEVSVTNGSGYGTIGIYARTFSSTTASIGSDITYTSDAVNGDYFTVNHDGLYFASYTDGGAASDTVGISLNFSSTTAFGTSWGTGSSLCVMTFANSASSCSILIYLSSGDVLRAHSNSNIGANVSGLAKFVVTKIR